RPRWRRSRGCSWRHHADRRGEEWADRTDSVLPTRDDVLTADDDVADVLHPGDEEDLRWVGTRGVRTVESDGDEVRQGALDEKAPAIPAEREIALLAADLVKLHE